VYSYEILPEARDQVDGLPRAALIYYAELITFVELTPWDAAPYRGDNPDGNMRKWSVPDFIDTGLGCQIG
jgi:hypothetical protein